MAGKNSKSAAGKGAAKKSKSAKPAAKAKAPAKKSPVKASAKKAPAKAAPKKAAAKPAAKKGAGSKAKASPAKKSSSKVSAKKPSGKSASAAKAKSSKGIAAKLSAAKKSAIKKTVAPVKSRAKSAGKTITRAVKKSEKIAKKKVAKIVPAAKKTAGKAIPVAKKDAKKIIQVAKKNVKKLVRIAKKDARAAIRFGKKEAKVAVRAVKQIVKSKLVSAQKQSGPKAASTARTASTDSGRDSRKTDERAAQKMPLKQTTLEKFKAPTAPVRVRVTDAPEDTEAPPVERKIKLKADDLKKLRNSLLQERSRIMEEIRTLDEQALPEGVEEGANQQPGFSLQLADSASENVSVETALILRSTEDEELAKIEDALRAIETGDYGVCHRCHEAISMERLLVKPMARYCVPCLRLLEAGKA